VTLRQIFETFVLSIICSLEQILKLGLINASSELSNIEPTRNTMLGDTA